MFNEPWHDFSNEEQRQRFAKEVAEVNVPKVEAVGADAPADVIVAFFARAAEIGARLPALAERIYPAGAVWAAWPRRAGGHTSDITDDVVREHALALGLVDVKVAAIDDDWSGLRLVWRVVNRGR